MRWLSSSVMTSRCAHGQQSSGQCAQRGGILECIKEAVADPAIKAIVLTCARRTFIAGADITEFGKPPKPPGASDVLSEIENSPKPIVAAIHGTALGGGLKVALACHFRVATKDAKLGPAGS